MYTMIDGKAVNLERVRYFYLDETHGIQSLKFVFGEKETLDFADFADKKSAKSFFEEFSNDVCAGHPKPCYSTKDA